MTIKTNIVTVEGEESTFPVLVEMAEKFVAEGDCVYMILGKSMYNYPRSSRQRLVDANHNSTQNGYCYVYEASRYATRVARRVPASHVFIVDAHLLSTRKYNAVARTLIPTKSWIETRVEEQTATS